MSAPENHIDENAGAERVRRSMQVSHHLIAWAVGALILGAVLFEVLRIGPPDRPAVQSMATDSPLPPCMGLAGRELERCQVLKQVRPDDYEKGPPEEQVDASFNSARARRGTGIENVSSAGTTVDPPN